jgi:hypothetical protein
VRPQSSMACTATTLLNCSCSDNSDKVSGDGWLSMYLDRN